MAKIPDYTAPNTALHPDDKGFAAFETEGRRTGPLYNEAGQLLRGTARDIGDANALAGRWPFNFLALQAAQKKDDARGIRVEGGFGGGGSAGSGGSRGGGGGRGNGGTSQGAAALGRMAHAMAGHGSQTIDTETGLPIPKRTSNYGTTLENGELVRVDKRTGEMVDKSGRPLSQDKIDSLPYNGPNGGAERAADRYPYTTEKQRAAQDDYNATRDYSTGVPYTPGQGWYDPKQDPNTSQYEGPIGNYGGGGESSFGDTVSGWASGIASGVRNFFGGEAAGTDEEQP